MPKTTSVSVGEGGVGKMQNVKGVDFQTIQQRQVPDSPCQLKHPKSVIFCASVPASEQPLAFSANCDRTQDQCSKTSLARWFRFDTA